MTRFDEAAIAERTRLFREAVERALRADDPDVSDEAVAEALARIPPPRVAWGTLHHRQDGARTTATTDHGMTGTTPEELARLARHLPGGANRGGRHKEDPAPHVAKYRAEVVRRIRAHEATDIEIVAPLMSWSVRTVRRHVIAAGFLDWPDFVAECRRGAR